MTDVETEAMRWQKARVFLEALRRHARELTVNEMRELREQALSGEVDAAVLRLQDILIGRVV